MTAMDQAFIRAYRQQGEETAPSLAVRPAVPLSEMLGEEPAAAAARPAPEAVPLREAAATPAEAAGSIERLFTRLAKPAKGSIESTLPKRTMVSAAETLGIVRPILRADPGSANVPLSAMLAPHSQAVRDRQTAEAPRNLPVAIPLAEESTDAAAVAEPQTAAAAAAEPATPALAALSSAIAAFDAPQAALKTHFETTAFAVAATAAASVAVGSEMAAAMEPAAWTPPTPSSYSLELTELAGLPAPPADEAASTAEASPAAPAAPAPWQPMLQVDHVVWPRICTQLNMVAVAQLDQLTAALLAAAAGGRKAMAVGGCRAGDGATTMLLCAARQLARRGMRVLAADACFHDPQLARRLGMLPDVGWQDVFAGRAALEDAIIVSAEDRLALLPAAARPSSPQNAFVVAGALDASLDELARHYDVVLVDVGSLEDCLSRTPPTLGGGSRLDAAVVVHNLRSTDAAGLAGLERKLADAGVVQVGVIENFVRSS